MLYRRFVEPVSQFVGRLGKKGMKEIKIKQENPFAKEELELYVMGKDMIPHYTIWQPRQGEELETDWVICR